MAEEEREERKERKKGFWGFLREVFQNAGSVAGLVAVKPVIEELAQELVKKAGRKVGKKVEEFVGLEPDPSGEGITDDAICRMVKKLLTSEQRVDLNTFEQELKRKNPDCYKKFKGYIAWVANVGGKERKISKKTQGKNGPQDVTSFKEYDLESAKSVYEDLLGYDTYKNRFNFLRGEGAFELRKKTVPSKAEELARKAAKATKEFAAKKAPEVKQAVDESADDFNKTASDWAERMKALRDSIRR